MTQIAQTRPIPHDFDAHVFVGLTLEMICFTQNQIYFHFSAKVTVCAESDFEHQNPGSQVRTISFPVANSDLMELLEHTVVLASFDEAQTLMLTFDNKHVLRFPADVQNEAYKITTDRDEFFCLPRMSSREQSS